MASWRTIFLCKSTHQVVFSTSIYSSILVTRSVLVYNPCGILIGSPRYCTEVCVVWVPFQRRRAVHDFRVVPTSHCVFLFPLWVITPWDGVG